MGTYLLYVATLYVFMDSYVRTVYIYDCMDMSLGGLSLACGLYIKCIHIRVNTRIVYGYVLTTLYVLV
jgi:hypothetical protein